jgi:hypothetical protein
MMSPPSLTEVAVAEPLNGTIEIAGPEPIRMDEFVRRFLSASGDARLFREAHCLLPCQQRHDDRTRGDLRSGARDHSIRQ